MIDIKSLNEIILNMINNIRTTSPDIDIKEGTFLRDAIINPVAKEISKLYGTKRCMQTWTVKTFIRTFLKNGCTV